MRFKKGMKIIGANGTLEVLEEFEVAMTIRKGTKAVICREGNNYFVCNCNNNLRIKKG